MNKIPDTEVADPGWKSLYRIGGAAALAAGIVFRRNLGVEIALFSAQKHPDSIIDWYRLLQTNRLLGLAYLNIFDIINYALVGLMFLALVVLLRRVNKSYTAIAALLGFLGIAVYFASNTAFTLLSLSDQYASATGEAQRTPLLSAGQAMLALNRFSSSGAQPGSGGYLSLLLIAAAGMIFSFVMLRSKLFGRATAYAGILANGLDLVYCTVFAFTTTAIAGLLAVLFIPAAGLFFLIWHVLVGWRLFQLGRLEVRKDASQPIIKRR
ncbi:MAG: DUF4386 family protein [Omnitrophica WOR_2 bacterium]